MPTKTLAMTGHAADFRAATDHFIACGGSKLAARARGRFDQNEQVEALATTPGDNRASIQGVTPQGTSAQIDSAGGKPHLSAASPRSRSTVSLGTSTRCPRPCREPCAKQRRAAKVIGREFCSEVASLSSAKLTGACSEFVGPGCVEHSC